jgi:hypothetical protein
LNIERIKTSMADGSNPPRQAPEWLIASLDGSVEDIAAGRTKPLAPIIAAMRRRASARIEEAARTKREAGAGRG